ncbi:MAG TPA: CpXC domain-containing protein [Kofleriaceae bacterium]|nr:CpXC domain-containing protein [Kofleriaceae bacterium]
MAGPSAPFDDPAQLDALLAALGPVGFLARATRDEAAVDAVYRKVQAAAKVLPVVLGLPAGAQLDADSEAGLRAWCFTPSSTDAECTKMFEQRFRVQVAGGGGGGDVYGLTGELDAGLPAADKPCLLQLWTVCEALPPASVEGSPRLQGLLRDRNHPPGVACYAGPGTGEQGDVLLGYRADGALAPGGGALVYRAGSPGPGAPEVSEQGLAAALRRVAAQLGEGEPAPALVPATIACRCGARYAAEVAAGLHVPLRPDLRRQILDGTFHRCFCPECGMTTLIDDLVVLTDFARRQWLTVAPSTGLLWRGRWLALARGSFEAAMVQGAPAIVASWAPEMTHRLCFGLGALREQLIAAEAGLDDRVVELLKIQLVRDLRDRFSGADYFHLAAVTPAGDLWFERTHPGGLIRGFSVPRALYEALAGDPALPALIALAFPDGLAIDHRAMLIPEADATFGAALPYIGGACT